MKNKLLITAIALLASGTMTVSAAQPPESQAQTQTAAMINASGTVLDQEGEPVIGASVIPAGQSTGVTTDVNGQYNIKVKAGTKLTISYIGHKRVTVPAAADTKVTLEGESTLLDEVVAMGYGTQKKKLVTGATVQVKGDDIAKQNTVNPLGALQSQTPGVNITQTNGFIGQGFKVNIRGIGTIGNSSPLYVIDGVANADINNLNPSDIESIDVLKDAASAAIYGARAANGVILVTTKKGKEGTNVITYDGYAGVQNLAKMPHILNAQEFMAIQDEGRVMDGLSPYAWETYLPAADLAAIQNGTWKGTNWLDETRNKNAVLTNHALNFSGGSADGNYAIGLAYTYQEATMGVPSDIPAMNRYNARVNSERVVKRLNGHDFITVGETVSYRYQEIHGSYATGGIYWNGVHNMLVMSPLMHAYNANGDYYMQADVNESGYSWDTANGANKNPIAYLDYVMNQNRTKAHNLTSSVYLQVQPIERLKFRSLFGYIMAASSYRSYTPVYHITDYIRTSKDKVSQSLSVSSRWSWENTVAYDFTLQDKNHFDVLIGQSAEKWGYNSDSMSATKEGSLFDDLAHAYLSNVPTTPESVTSVTGTPGSQGTLASFFGRINYNFDEKYLASFIMRADGSSVFARGHRWGYFPSVSAGWVMSNENFMEDTHNWLDFLKIRGSWGQNGNCSVSTFQYLSLITSSNTTGGYTFGQDPSTIFTGSYPARLTNPDLKWETQEQLDFGFDARFLRSRLGVEFDWYRRTTKDWLVTAPVLSGYGAAAPYINGGNITNTGVELGVHWNDNVGRDFSYSAGVNFAYNKNKVTKIANADGIIHGPGSILWEGSEECYRQAEVGQPVGYFFGYKSAGIFQNQAEIDAYQGPKLNGDATRPGDVIWVDYNEDGKIDADDRTFIGNPHPDFTLGVNISLQWKWLDFAANGYGAFGHQILKCYRDYVASPMQNFTSDIFDRWHGEGTSNTMPRLTASSSSNWNRVSDLYIENGDFFKLKNIVVGFDFKKAFKKIPFEQLRVYASAQNLFTITKYSGMDPEIGFGGEDAGSYAGGIDLGYYPSSRNIMFGLNIKY